MLARLIAATKFELDMRLGGPATTEPTNGRSFSRYAGIAVDLQAALFRYGLSAPSPPDRGRRHLSGLAQWVTYGSRQTATGTRQPNKPRSASCQRVMATALIMQWSMVDSLVSLRPHRAMLHGSGPWRSRRTNVAS